MDRRSWPWKKKSSSEKSPTTPPAQRESSISPTHIPGLYDDQESVKVSANYKRESDSTATRWQNAEEKPSNVNEKLAAALSENIAKDKLIEQHTKVAEEAVCGWEKAEAEAAAFKVKFETALHQKSATDDRLSHLDGALKECMRQLRKVREEQDQKAHDAEMKTRKEWDKVRSEFEAKIAGRDQQIVELGAQNGSLTRSLQEHSRSISQLSNAKSQVETELSMLQIHLKSMEKENASLKYNLHVLNKEIDIRNEDRQYSKKELDSTSKQLLESTKKIAKLEVECQKLRILVRRKLPGPAALAQMKLEVQSVCSEMGNDYKRKSPKRNCNLYGESPFKIMQQRLQTGNREVEMLTERMYAMEEETKMLREILAQRNKELHVARLQCEKTAIKMSTLDCDPQCSGQCSGARLSLVDVNLNVSKAARSYGAASVVSLSDASINDDEASCADVWASALVSELDHLKRDSSILTAERSSNPTAENFMDDFAEMEQLALQGCDNAVGLSIINSQKNILAPSTGFIDREKEMQATDRICAELRSKLDLKEKQLLELQIKNTANEAALKSFQEKLDFRFETHGENADMGTVLEIATKAYSNTSMENLQQIKCTKISESTDKHIDRDASVNSNSPHLFDYASKNPYVELEANIGKVIGQIEEIGRALDAGLPLPQLINAVQEQVHSDKATTFGLYRNHSPDGGKCPLNESIQKVSTVSKMLMEGKTDFKEFLEELSGTLDLMKRLVLDFVGISAKRMSVLHDPSRQVLNHIHMDLCNPRDGQKNPKCADEPTKTFENSTSHTTNQARKGDASCTKSTDSTSKQQSSEQHVSELNAANSASKQSKQLVEENLEPSKCFGDNPVSELEPNNPLVVSLQQKLGRLEVELQQEHGHLQEALAQIQQLQNQLDRKHEAEASFKDTESESSIQDADKVRTKKEQKIAAAVHKLADCQRTIGVLGEQLKSLSSPRDSSQYFLDLKPDQKPSLEESAHCQTSKLQTEVNVTDLHSHSEKNRMNYGHDLEQYHWTPLRHIESSPYLRRGQLISPCLEKPYDRRQGLVEGLLSPARIEYVGTKSVPDSPRAAYKSSIASSPGRFLAPRSKGVTANNLSKAFNSVSSTKQHSEKHSHSGLSKFFSRTKP